MKKISVILFAGVLTSLLASAAVAGTPRVDRREARQHVRIVEGRRSGELTRGEMVRLRAGQRHVRRMERRTGADGVVSRGERRRLENAQDRESRRIYRLKHNARQRGC
jgi:hypothetical protein